MKDPDQFTFAGNDRFGRLLGARTALRVHHPSVYRPFKLITSKKLVVGSSALSSALISPDYA